MTPEAIAALLRDYGPLGFATLLLVVVGWLYVEIKNSFRREVKSERANAIELIALNSKFAEALAASTRSIDGLNLNIEHRNPLTAVLGESQKAANLAIEHMQDAIERLVRSIDEDKRESDRQRGVADAVRSDIISTLRRIEASHK